jgi:hypothetical protein
MELFTLKVKTRSRAQRDEFWLKGNELTGGQTSAAFKLSQENRAFQNLVRGANCNPTSRNQASGPSMTGTVHMYSVA